MHVRCKDRLACCQMVQARQSVISSQISPKFSALPQPQTARPR